MKKEETLSKGSVKDWWGGAFVVFLRLSNWIVWPILAGLFIGRWLDDKYDKEPWLLLLSIGISFIISMVGLTMGAIREMKKFDKKDDKENGK